MPGMWHLRATRIPYALLVNFGRPALQYDTFDLERLPSASLPDAAAPCGKPQPQYLLSTGSRRRSHGAKRRRSGSGAPLKTFGV